MKPLFLFTALFLGITGFATDTLAFVDHRTKIELIFDDDSCLIAKNLFQGKHLLTHVEYDSLPGDSSVYHYYRSGSISAEERYLDGKKNGDFFRYHLDGSISSHVFYLNDLKEGEEVFYRTFSEGNLPWETNHYEQGELVATSRLIPSLLQRDLKRIK